MGKIYFDYLDQDWHLSIYSDSLPVLPIEMGDTFPYHFSTKYVFSDQNNSDPSSIKLIKPNLETIEPLF